MNHLIQEIDRIIEERSLLKHPFYQAWSDGKLTRESLAGYSKEYYQLVKAVPIFMAQLMDHVPESLHNEFNFNQQEELLKLNHQQEIQAVEQKFALIPRILPLILLEHVLE